MRLGSGQLCCPSPSTRSWEPPGRFPPTSPRVCTGVRARSQPCVLCLEGGTFGEQYSLSLSTRLALRHSKALISPAASTRGTGGGSDAPQMPPRSCPRASLPAAQGAGGRSQQQAWSRRLPSDGPVAVAAPSIGTPAQDLAPPQPPPNTGAVRGGSIIGMGPRGSELRPACCPGHVKGGQEGLGVGRGPAGRSRLVPLRCPADAAPGASRCPRPCRQVRRRCST